MFQMMSHAHVPNDVTGSYPDEHTTIYATKMAIHLDKQTQQSIFSNTKQLRQALLQGRSYGPAFLAMGQSDTLFLAYLLSIGRQW